MTRHLIAWLVCALSLGCDREPDPVPTPAPVVEIQEAEAEPAPETDEASARAEAPAAPVAPIPLTPAQLARKRELLREGRHLVREGDMTQAFARFEELVALSPRSPPILCEAGYVAHRAESASAEPLLRRGMSAFAAYPTLTDERRLTLARCEYNLGLVLERRGALERAERSFASSLQHRDNATVRARLEAVREAIEALDHVRVWPSLGALLASMLEPADEDEEFSGCEWDGQVLAEAEGGAAGFVETAGVDCYMVGGGALYFAFRAGPGLVAFIVDQFEEDDEDHAATNSSEWGGFTFARMGSGEAGHWRATYSTTEHHTIYEDYEPPEGEEDSPLCAYTGGSTRTAEHTLICSVRLLGCVDIVTERTVDSSGGGVFCNDTEDADIPQWALERAGMDRADLVDDEEDRPPVVEHRIELTIEDDRVRLRTVEGTHDVWDAPADGELTLRALMEAEHRLRPLRSN